MNSLLQTLFMTTEFRSALFGWRYNPKKDGDERLCIPLQLQRLFARLCLSACPHIETKNVTDSFGWHGNEVFQQQDVQELIRVLLDAIDKTFCANDLDNPITPLYRGLLHDYLRCTQCNYSRIRSDAFMDIPLVIRGVSSLEEALDLYMTPEVLDKSNQWYCERCERRVDALKGLKLKELPPIITLQLKRFDYNYSTMTRIKLNNRVSFPFYLDMGKYHKSDIDDQHTPVPVKKTPPSDTEDVAVIEEADQDWSCALCTYLNIPQLKRCEMCSTPRPQLNADEPQRQPDADASPAAPAPPPAPGSEDSQKPGEKDTPEAAAEEPYQPEEVPHVGENDHIYQLFSVMIHSGGAMGGHYYAYIKSQKTGRWYSFNDMHVTHITEQDVWRMFGDEEKRMTAANAYLLMYRKMEPTTATATTEVSACAGPEEGVNELDGALDEIPEDLRKEVEEENRRYDEERAEHQRKLDTIDLRIFYGNTPTMIHIHKQKTLRDATELAYREAKVSESVPLSSVRLRSYNSTTGTVGLPFTGNEDKKLTDLGIFSQRSLLLETKNPSDEWPAEETEGLTLKVIKLNEQTLELEPALTVSLADASTATLAQLKAALEEKAGIRSDAQRLLRVCNSDVEFIEGSAESTLVNDCKISDGSLLYVEELKADGLSLLKQRFEAEQNTIELNFNNPNTDEEDIKIAIDQRETIGTLKKRIGAIVGLPNHEFRLRRKLLNKEYKDEDETLQQCYLFDGSALLVEKGRSLKAGEILSKVYMYSAEEEDLAFTLVLDSMIVTEGDLSAKVKAHVRERLGEDYLPWDRVRVREKIECRLGTAMKRGKTLKQTVSALRDGVELALQVVDEDAKAELDEAEMVLETRHFCPATMELKRGEELGLLKDSSVLALRTVIGAKYDVPVQFVAVAKPFKHQLGVVSSLLSLNWELYDDAVITKSPLYLRDGDLMLWRDLREIPKEIATDGLPQVVGSVSRPRESGIVIRTVHDLPPGGGAGGEAKEELLQAEEPATKAAGDVATPEPVQ